MAYKVGSASQMRSPELTVQDLKDIRTDTEWSYITSPFGMTPEELRTQGPRVYLKKAVEWKGATGSAFLKVAPAHGALLAANELVRKISRAYSNIKGSGVDPATGTIMPNKAMRQRNWRTDCPELVDEYNNKVVPRMKSKEVKYMPFEILSGSVPAVA